MLFRELIFRDFIPFKGENRIVFPAPSDKTSLVVILAPSNAGKTSVIRALKFLLYGELWGENENTAHGLINKATMAELQAPAQIEAWVQATIEVAGKSRTVRRRIEARKYANGSVQTKGVFLEETIHERVGDKFRLDEGDVQRALSSLVPEELFDYFYFQGETLAEKLVKGTGNQAIREGLSTLLHQDKWESAIHSLEKVRQAILKDLRNIQGASEEYSSKLTTIEALRKKQQERHNELENWRTKLATAETDFDRSEEQIRSLSSGTSHQQLTQELGRKRQEAKQAASELSRLENQLCNLVGESKGLPFFQTAFQPSLRLLGQMKDENLLPADVTEPFVIRLLESEAQICICGRSLHPKENRTERACIEQYRARAMAVDLSSNLLDLLNALEPRAKQSYATRITSLSQRIGDTTSERDATIVNQADLDAAIADFEERRAKSNYEEIVKLQHQQREAAELRAKASGAIRELETRAIGLDSQLKQLEVELRGIENTGGDFRMLKLSAARKRADELQSLIQETLDHLKGSFHSILQQSVSRYYDKAVTDGSKARIDPNSLLPSIQRDGSTVLNLGGGQRQLLVLAHIISLAELRRTLHEELDAIGIKTGKLDDQSFFLDSVFAPCDEVYAGIVAKFLPGKARQMVLLLASQQWHDKIRKGVEAHVDRAFSFTVHTPNPEANSDEYEVGFQSRRFSLLKKIQPGQQAYSTIEEIK